MGVTLVWWKRKLPHAAAGCQKKAAGVSSAPLSINCLGTHVQCALF